MGIALIGAYLFKREPDTGNSLGLAAFCILVFNPNQLFNVGFQLSFASVAAIAFLYPKLAEISRAVKLKNVCLRFIAEGLLVSLSAWLFTAPIIAWRIHTFSPVTVLANLVIVPVATLITLSGFSLLVSGLLLPFIAPAFGAASELLVFVLISINQAMLKLPFSYLKF
jgi:competence protein ComEC